MVPASLVQKGKTTTDRRTAPDGVTKGWIIAYPWPDQTETSQLWRTIPGTLVIARHGHVIRRITAGPSIRNWDFWMGGRQVVFETGPLHGPTDCVRADARTGKVLETWPGCDNLPENAPAWAKAADGMLVADTSR
jgi:hypothetical protein